MIVKAMLHHRKGLVLSFQIKVLSKVTELIGEGR